MRCEVENNREVFRYLTPSSNDKLLSMTDRDLVNIILSLRRYNLELRETLGINKNVTFGTEIEFEDSYRDEIELKIYNTFPDRDWRIDEDRTLYNGGELLSPILRDTKETWLDLNTACDIISQYAKVLDNASAHIHIGMHILGNNAKYWRNFVKLWMTYENIISRFLYGEYLSPRPSLNEFAKPISKLLIEDFDRLEEKAKYHTAEHIIKALYTNEDRKRAVSFKYAAHTNLRDYNKVVDKNTIEFRTPNGTFDPIIWQNNINLLVKLLEYSKSKNFDDNLISIRLKQIEKENLPSNLHKYSEIYIEQAIELADLIFTNNLDKLYFLRQYIKDSRVSTKPLVKSKSFTI